MEQRATALTDSCEHEGFVQAQGELVKTVFDDSTIVSELDDESIYITQAVAVGKCWSFLVRSIRSGLVVDSLPHRCDDVEEEDRTDGAQGDRRRSSSGKLGYNAGQEWTAVT
jgi:hypothetical protein